MTNAERIDEWVLAHLDTCLFSVEAPKPSRRGKVRDLFDLDQTMYMINTDRVSAFDQVLGTIPLKGALLCEQAHFWFEFTKDICPNHLLDRPDPQIMVCKKAEPLAVEVIVRAYLAGSLMREDKKTRGSSYGIAIDPALKDYEKFEKPIVTPTTKAPIGQHDEPISPQEILKRNLMSQRQWQMIEDYALGLFNACSGHCQKNGLLLVDTKYEFGLIDGKIHLIDEVHTSDSSRFFIEEDYHKSQFTKDRPVMLDKEFLRQYLIEMGIDPKNPNKDIVLDDNIRKEVAKRYYALTEKITNRSFTPPSRGAHERVHQYLAQL